MHRAHSKRPRAPTNCFHAVTIIGTYLTGLHCWKICIFYSNVNSDSKLGSKREKKERRSSKTPTQPESSAGQSTKKYNNESVQR